MRYSVYGCKCRPRVLFAIFFIVFIAVIVTRALLSNDWSIIPNNAFSSSICDQKNRSYIAKPFFNFACDKLSLVSLKSSFYSENHICDQLYPSNVEPNLFSRLHAELQPFKRRKILFTDIENISKSCTSCHHIQIIGNKLYNVPRPKAWNAETRSRSVKISIKHVLDTFSTIPDLDIFLNVNDIVDLPNGLNVALFNAPIFGITKSRKVKRGLRSDGIVLMPCFTFWSWPEARVGPWSQKFDSILNYGQKLKYEERVQKLFWRGAEFLKRRWFIQIANKYPEILDIKRMEWNRTKKGLALTPSNTFKTLEQHCHYKYLLHQEGVTYSSRLKYLLLCGSAVVFNVIEYWEEYWYHLLENGKNIVLFENNGNETALKNTVDFLKRHDDKVKDIGIKGRQLVHDYLNEHAVSCYWWKLLVEYAKLLGYKPVLHPDAVYIDDFILGGSP